MAYVLSEQYKELIPQLEGAINEAAKIIERSLERFGGGDLYPVDYKDGKYTAVYQADPRGNYWEEGFWPGQLWLAYEATGNEKFRETAEKNVEDFYKRVSENNNIDWHHDTGFLYTPSCVSAYKLTGSEKAKRAALMAAYSLSRRFRYRGEFIQSMGSEIDDEHYRFIVDTLLNLPLLFWASEVTGDDTYRNKAEAHIKTTLRYAMRDDSTTFHHVLMNNKTGEFIRGLTWQGAGDNSCWSRGQAWVVYGLALAYGYTRDESLLEPFCKVTDYFMEHLPADYVPYWDFIFTEGTEEPRDSSAAAIVCCGIMEMAKHLPSDCCNMQKYLDKTAKIMESLINSYAAKDADKCEGLLLHSTGAKPQGKSVDACLTYGDYYYLEALIRASRDWRSYW